ncbi:hypothetical protein [Ramlibacter algicola]|uniref:Uncharacterized protein n=1 Tax=Ramlibacter algicola TaxID=2795217 RepID=A0A934PYG6_9BURK|nr:hypothetical protein [Ramlibacter algicola]MBK0390974.1 hypothetical protein [Ramlibacter algicola]
MCHLASHRASPASNATETAGAPSSSGLRPRWVAGAVAVAIAGLATAALLDRDTPRSAPLAETSSVGATAATATPLVPVSEPPMRGALLPDDDVPTTTGSSKPMLGHCDHGA